MGLEMNLNTNIAEGIFYSLPAPSYATYLPMYYYMMIFPCSPQPVLSFLLYLR